MPPPHNTVELARARAQVRRVLGRGRENFVIRSWLVPPELREHYASVYAFCRVADDLADERVPGQGDDAARECALSQLREFRAGLAWAHARGSYEGTGDLAEPAGLGTDHRLLFVALGETMRLCRLSREPFDWLLDAFEQDQRVVCYDTWEQLLAYCSRSANPVGRIVLALHGYGDGRMSGDEALEERARLRVRASDAICTGLQLANFWQDVRRDIVERNRVYLPLKETGLELGQLRDWMSRGNEPSVRQRFADDLRAMVRRTWVSFDCGRGLPGLVDRRTGWATWLYRMAGEEVLAEIERFEYTTLWERVRVGKLSRAALLARASIGYVRGRAAPTK